MRVHTAESNSKRAEGVKRWWASRTEEERKAHAAIGGNKRLAVLRTSEHRKLAAERMRGKWQDEAYKQKMLQAAKKRVYKTDRSQITRTMWTDPKFRAKCIAAAKRRHKNPVDRAKVLLALAKGRANVDPVANRKACIEGNIRSWKDPVRRARRIASIRKAVQSPSHRAKQSAIFRAKWRETCLYIRGTRYEEMRSWWEVGYAEWLDKQKVAWVYEKVQFDIGDSPSHMGNLYGPDFYLPTTDEFIEIKGLVSRRYIAKAKRMAEVYPYIKITVLNGTDLKVMGLVKNGQAVLSPAADLRRTRLREEVASKAHS